MAQTGRRSSGLITITITFANGIQMVIPSSHITQILVEREIDVVRVHLDLIAPANDWRDNTSAAPQQLGDAEPKLLTGGAHL